MSFTLHPRLQADTFFIADWPLCRVLLMNDARYPWLILVPRRDGMVELMDLSVQDRVLLTEEIAKAGEVAQTVRLVLAAENADAEFLEIGCAGIDGERENRRSGKQGFLEHGFLQ